MPASLGQAALSLAVAVALGGVIGFERQRRNRAAQEARVRQLLLQGFTSGELHLRALDSANIEGTERVEVNATLTAPTPRDAAVEEIVGQMSLEASITAARWHTGATLQSE